MTVVVMRQMSLDKYKDKKDILINDLIDDLILNQIT